MPKQGVDDCMFMKKISHTSHGCGGGDSGDPTNAAAAAAAAARSGATSSSITTTSRNTTNNNNNNNNTNSRDVYRKHLNKISHKICKPIRRPPTFDQNQPQNLPPSETQAPPPPPSPPPPSEIPPSQAQPQAAAPPPQQHQPPVYNINKNDFRDVVQRLTGSPAHEQQRISTPPPIQPPKPPSSRLQRIRPPPLSQITNRPPPPPNNLNSYTASSGFLAGQRQPLSPLPPFPAVHAAAESPISAYMRFLKSSASSSAASPKWNNLTLPPPPPPPPPAQQQNIPPVQQAPIAMPQFPLLPTSLLPYGCIQSPRSAYALLSPTAQLGFQQLPLSPSMPVPSPRWKGI